MSSREMRVELDGGKYTVIWDGTLRAERYGQPWRDMNGDNLVLSMLQEIVDVRLRVELLKARVSYLESKEGETK